MLVILYTGWKCESSRGKMALLILIQWVIQHHLVLPFAPLRQYNGTFFNTFTVLHPTCCHCFPLCCFWLAGQAIGWVLGPIDYDIKRL